MPVCTKCDAVLPEGKKFCKVCGAPVSQEPAAQKCPACGSPVTPGKKFCKACGEPVPATTIQESSPVAPARTPAAVTAPMGGSGLPKPARCPWWRRWYVFALVGAAVAAIGLAGLADTMNIDFEDLINPIRLKRTIEARRTRTEILKVLEDEILRNREPFLNAAAGPVFHLSTADKPVREQAPSADLPLGVLLASFPYRGVSIESDEYRDDDGRELRKVSCMYGAKDDYREIQREDSSAENKSVHLEMKNPQLVSTHDLVFQKDGRWHLFGIRVNGRDDSQAFEAGSEFLNEVCRTFRPSTGDVDVHATAVRRHENFFSQTVLVGAPAGSSRYRSIDDLLGLLRALAAWRQENRPVRVWDAKRLAEDQILILVPTFATDDTGFLWLRLLRQSALDPEWHIGLVWQVTARNLK